MVFLDEHSPAHTAGRFQRERFFGLVTRDAEQFIQAENNRVKFPLAWQALSEGNIGTGQRTAGLVAEVAHSQFHA